MKRLKHTSSIFVNNLNDITYMAENNMIIDAVRYKVDNPDLQSIFDATADPTNEQMIHLQQLSDSMQDHMIKGDLNNDPVVPNAFLKKRKTLVRDYKKIGRNDPCPCGSGLKYKNCCLKEGSYETYHEITHVK